MGDLELWVRSHNGDYAVTIAAKNNYTFKVSVTNGLLIGKINGEVVAEIPIPNDGGYRV